MSESEQDKFDDNSEGDKIESKDDFNDLTVVTPETEPVATKVIKKEKVTEEKVRRIPWREFIRSQFLKFLGTIIIMALMVRIIVLSGRINELNGNVVGDINPDGIISTDGAVFLELMILSSTVYLLILGFFSKLVFFDHKEDFGIETYKSIKAVLFFLLTISFISLVYILFDVALTNIYLETLPTYLVWILKNELNLNFPFIDRIPVETDRQAYSDIRGGMFLLLFVFTLCFPLAMSISIFTRYGRRQLQARKQKPREKYRFKDWVKFIAVLPLEFVLLTLFFIIDNLQPDVPIHLIIVFIMIVLAIWWAFQLIILILRGVRNLTFLMYSNLSMIIPIVVLFYVLPGLLWATWDMFTLILTGDHTNTIYALSPNSNNVATDLDPTIDGFSISDLSTSQLLLLYWQTFVLNLSDFFRIVELDFVLVIGVASVVIGFAEGYSLFAIVRSIMTGVSIARTGRVAQRSAPRMIVISSRLVLLGAWLGLLWDKFVVLYHILKYELNLPIPDLGLERLFEQIFGIAVSIEDLGGVFIALSILIVPLYFIITSSFKFLSVSLVADRIKHDTQIFFYLISSAFILIVAQILADIAALPTFQTTELDDPKGHKNFLPLGDTATTDILPFISKIFEAVEAIGFYIGAIISLGMLMKYLTLRAAGKKTKLFDED